MQEALYLIPNAAKTNKQNQKRTKNSGEVVEKSQLLYTGGRLAQLLWRAVWKFLKKLKIDLLYDPTILPLGICLK
jgi:hypothetical protein